jgi:hypothetical protein
MKTVNFSAFENDAIKKRDLNFLKGGKIGSGDPVEDLITPPRR